MEQLQVIYNYRPPHIWGNICAFPHILGSNSSYMTMQLFHSEFPYIWGKFDFLFYQCMDTAETCEWCECECVCTKFVNKCKQSELGIYIRCQIIYLYLSSFLSFFHWPFDIIRRKHSNCVWKNIQFFQNGRVLLKLVFWYTYSVPNVLNQKYLKMCIQ